METVNIQKLNSIKEDFRVLKRIKKSLRTEKESFDVKIKTMTETKDRETQVNFLIQTVTEETQEQLQYHIHMLVTVALEIVFGNRYSFEANIVSKRNNTEVVLVIKDNDGNEFEPMESSGGGLVDIVSFALRVSLWSLSKKTLPIMILDEPFRNLSEDLQESAGELMKYMSETTGIQFIMSSHEHNIIQQASSIFKCSKENQYTMVEAE